MLEIIKKGAFLLMAALVFSNASAQNVNQDERADEVQLNTITTAVPFLMISPDARSGAMGDVGAATDPDGASIHWNPAKMAYVPNKMGFAVSYTPWLRALVPDINLAYISGYGKIGKKGLQTLSGSLRYFSLGSITFTDAQGGTIGDFTPNEFAIDISYARKLSEEFSGGIALRYIYSNLTGGINVGGADTKPGQAGAADISFFYQTKRIEIADRKSVLTAGINISNIGSKMSYTNTNEEDFIPINFRFGLGFKYFVDERNSIAAFFDINKLMVPTPPIYDDNPYINDQLPPGDTLGAIGHPSNANSNFGAIIAGQDPNRSVPNGMFTSFGDAPGGSMEELREINIAVGLEYWYNKLFAIRAGYFHEHYSKGNRQFFTVGAGIRYNVFGLDFAYLIPTQQRHPLENTLRFTLTFDFEAFKKQNEEKNDD
ncbi:MAG: type IX secretion system outer membrane channel protein PorV [Flavobacteriales bacterium]|nr:type IX secretion system outer membrane channel protein PorV [Flavobacteriales bacterium]MCB9190761.1 type IX secretion system outer membrane channel protein PorV [Flavobacteriales bacterium]MCB9205291.1 type IX secretion system outer membrane channel protein PorV [Flavobacteriales bacterium]